MRGARRTWHVRRSAARTRQRRRWAFFSSLLGAQESRPDAEAFDLSELAVGQGVESSCEFFTQAKKLNRGGGVKSGENYRILDRLCGVLRMEVLLRRVNLRQDLRGPARILHATLASEEMGEATVAHLVMM